MPLERDEAKRRRGRHQTEDVGAALPRPFVPLRYLGFCLVAVGLLCCWQLVLLTRHIEPSAESGVGSISDVLWMHESNITALASQQRDLASVTMRLSEELRRQHDELAALRLRLDLQGADARAAGQAQHPQAWREQHQQHLAEMRSTVAAVQAQAAKQAQRLEQLADGSMTAPPLPPLAAAPSPPLSLGEVPADWLKSFSREEIERSAKEAEKWREGARNAFLHVWRGYRSRAWGKDEFQPVSGREGRKWGNLGLMILDSLSTMWVMGLNEQFDEAQRWVENSLQFESSGHVSFFEITIRALGGLISAHSLSGREVFLRKAKELADRMLPAFAEGEPGFPATQVNLHTRKGKAGWFQGSVLAEAGTVQLEFRYISQQTGDQQYAQHADRSMRSILTASGSRGLVPWGLSRTAPVRFVNSHVTLGALGDSYYEYLLKMHLQTAQTEPEWKDAWKRAMSDMQHRLVRKTNTGLTYVTEETNGNLNHKMDHLTCFVGGMLILGSRQLPPSERDPAWESTAAGLTETCYQMYHRQPSHLAPEAVRFSEYASVPRDMEIWNNQGQYLLRPETAESIFYMFYYTGDPKYRRMAGEILEAIETHARTNYGYSAVRDVRQRKPALKDELETFFLAETLKYLYLTFVPNPREVINLDEFVFNTEAHPIRIFRPTGAKKFLGGR